MTTPTMLTSLDASFLHLEHEDAPMHVGSVGIFEGEPLRDERGHVRLDDVRALLVARLPLLPRFRQRLQWSPLRQAPPLWVDDPGFDIARHVRLVHLPAPGDERALRELTARVHMERLDRHHPLWELILVDGLEHGRVAMIEKLHHALIDGVSGVDVAAVTLDFTPETPPSELRLFVPERGPSPLQLLFRDLATTAGDVVHLATAAASLVQHRDEVPAATLDGFREMLHAGFAPRSSLNDRIGASRRFEVISRSLDEVRQTKTRLGGTVNDVVLAAVTRGLHDLTAARGEDADTLKVLVPVSRRPDDQRGALGNQVASLFVDLPVGEGDARARFDTIHRTMTRLKASHEDDASASLLGFADHLPGAVVAAISALVHHQPFVNLVVTNVPASPVPLYLLGARLLDVYPVVPLARNLTVSVGILSYDSRLTLGLYADGDAFDDLDVFVSGIDAGFAELADLAGLTARSRAG
ncbi:MAG TPA: wax ester/triacylglycerol synthase family O-acyltransferase [Acidimicrobiales bacterium]|nr:wax ester/triacylglycerol synthase family O-acyltransferase [Acidimicrobiales bacterium]